MPEMTGGFLACRGATLPGTFKCAHLLRPPRYSLLKRAGQRRTWIKLLLFLEFGAKYFILQFWWLEEAFEMAASGRIFTILTRFWCLRNTYQLVVYMCLCFGCARASGQSSDSKYFVCIMNMNLCKSIIIRQFFSYFVNFAHFLNFLS